MDLVFDEIMSIGITACSIIMDVALVIKTAERHLIYFLATQLMSLAVIVFILWCICSSFNRVLL